ncbi:hypothetical protein LWI28_009493 [Acer negundo]|uniref:Uncharacterized protein n=1 Tax=Acer negundo TaxID=4023 RepID=A0AAD5JQK8_ACENE|nr:hypothetical protein LWI28_009493 [Acer negundo]KAK4857403.1 hypothetical protein QYF36_000091 [Acer negundo]
MSLLLAGAANEAADHLAGTAKEGHDLPLRWRLLQRRRRGRLACWVGMRKGKKKSLFGARKKLCLIKSHPCLCLIVFCSIFFQSPNQEKKYS